ncbi:hypothetical protein SAICODRAFT_86701 [Saitoella complicata NRRL Y-17804]|uniref:uncharacterized protein n=1 Tax=Saitoella complicata (strain BCRC 22490 / CBS 7301 / JCM 7358 / NBRC 10748 / NRRL Y-17804) TaxID=698492 RepID=UPI000867994C|nr:uncharacterized protein SAICODRAFT_86701 [Saitoella complicata NRRL Y-17804]ODQ56121.1 hypothetical protein SAICODRAFT_86701 [Saitoella complicata NRRL Y-17804]
MKGFLNDLKDLKNSLPRPTPAPGSTPPIPGNRPYPPPPAYGEKPAQFALTANGHHAPPEITSIKSGEWVHQRILLVEGRAGPHGSTFDASITVQHHLNTFPSQVYPVTDSHFKALVHLVPGPNQVRFVFEGLETMLNVSYLPLTQNPPLHLAILVAKDSPHKFDTMPNRGPNDLEEAKKKLRMAGYLWQSFTAEQMHRNGMGRRTFRLDEEWGLDTLSSPPALRQTARIHVIRTDKTTAELRHPNRAQQNPQGNDTGALFGITLDALRAAGIPFTNGKVWVACLLLDAHWDGKLITAHAALGGGAGDTQLGIFGSHTLWSWPSQLSHVIPAFTDTFRTDTRYVANDANECGTVWECANIGIGAFMHEVGHALTCPHQPDGVMLRDYVRLNRTFCVGEAPGVARGREKGKRVVGREEECWWHRLDIMRFRYHPLFRLPGEGAPINDQGPTYHPVEHGVQVTSNAGISLVEIYVDGRFRAHHEFPDQPEQELFLLESELREKAGTKTGKMKLEIISANQGQTTIEDFDGLLREGVLDISTHDGHPILKAQKFGLSGLPNSRPIQVIFPDSPITNITVFSGNSLDGLEFTFANSSRLLFGGRGGSPHHLPLNGPEGERISHFVVRSGVWVDGVEVFTNWGRRSGWFGGGGGSLHEVRCPEGYVIVGMWGSLGQWLDGIGVLYKAVS